MQKNAKQFNGALNDCKEERKDAENLHYID